MEYYCTLFDLNFLPQGLAMHASLQRHASNYKLVILCMDDNVKNALDTLSLKNVYCIELKNVETKEVLFAKKDRNRAEYCWTLTPILISAVFDMFRDASRVTYIDADCWFISNPQKILKEMDDANKDVLITEHDYCEQYDQSKISGKYCVQFVPFRNTTKATEVLKLWKDKCLEWCYAIPEPDRFGDQKYLDKWIEIFPDAVHVLNNKQLTLAPWNAQKYSNIKNIDINSCMYHFHGLRVFDKYIRANIFYKIPKNIKRKIYSHYYLDLHKAMKLIEQNCININYPSDPFKGFVGNIKRYYATFKNNEIWKKL